MPNIGILLGKPAAANPHKLGFKDILRVAELLAARVKILTEKVPYPYNVEIDAKRVTEIHTALKAIDSTPNGSVSRETLDEWVNELCTIRDQLGNWCAELVTFRKSDDRRSDGELMDDEIPF